jgi:hypothetical protein
LQSYFVNFDAGILLSPVMPDARFSTSAGVMGDTVGAQTSPEPVGRGAGEALATLTVAVTAAVLAVLLVLPPGCGSPLLLQPASSSAAIMYGIDIPQA